MLVTRTSTFNQHNNTLVNAGAVQSSLAKLQNQISSGVKTDTFQGLLGEVEAFTSLDDKLSRSEEFVKNNGILSSRVNFMDTTLENLLEEARSIANITFLRRNGLSVDNGGYEGQLEDSWDKIASQLNINFEGRYLFAGTRTDRKAVADEFPTLYNAEGLPEDHYYRGSDQNIVMRAEDGLDLEIGARADDISIQKLYAGFALAREGHTSDDGEKIARAYELMSESLQDLSLMRVNLAATQIRLDQSATQQRQLQLYWQQVKGEMIGTDLVAATTQVAIEQSILQASFQAFATINQLSLSDFI